MNGIKSWQKAQEERLEEVIVLLGQINAGAGAGATEAGFGAKAEKVEVGWETFLKKKTRREKEEEVKIEEIIKKRKMEEWVKKNKNYPITPMLSELLKNLIYFKDWYIPEIIFLMGLLQTGERRCWRWNVLAGAGISEEKLKELVKEEKEKEEVKKLAKLLDLC